jgi:hypothetical protein
MENGYSQKFTYATIVPFRDYSKLNDKPKGFNTFEVDDIFDDVRYPFTNKRSIDESNNKYYNVFTLPDFNPKKKINYFTKPKDDIGETFSLRFALNTANHSFHTIKDHQIKRHFGRPFSDIKTYYIERSIKKIEDKITIKCYLLTKRRQFNCIFFKKEEVLTSLTINTKTGNFTIIEKIKYGKKTSTKIRKNDFGFLNEILKRRNSFVKISDYMTLDHRLYNNFIKVFDDVEFFRNVNHILILNNKKLSNYNPSVTSLTIDLIKYFIRNKKIKMPDGDYYNYIINFYPTEKYLKKNDRKLVASVLHLFNIKSKITIKILHQHPNINLFSLVFICRILGDNYTKYLSNISELTVINNSNVIEKNYVVNKNLILNFLRECDFSLFDVEKENFVKLLNNECSKTTNYLNTEGMSYFVDHFRMIKQLRNYIPDLHMRSKTHAEFNEEHRELSKMVSSIKKGWVVEYQYDSKTIETIEEPIDYLINVGSETDPLIEIDSSMNGEKLYPFILKREEEYSEEGSFMHHCVASYSDKDRSMIVSLRTIDGHERVTIEYNIQDGHPIQKRYFCNKVPPDKFNFAMCVLDERIVKLAKWNTLNWKEKKKVPVKINGVEVVKEDKRPRSPFDNLIDPFLPF